MEGLSILTYQSINQPTYINEEIPESVGTREAYLKVVVKIKLD